MEEDLPNEFDLIVVGTGLTESIVAAAASRIGKTVLHIDSNEYYGGFWSSFNLESFIKYMQECADNKGTDTKHTTTIDYLPLQRNTFAQNTRERWFDFEAHGDVDGWNKEKILKEFRRFNVDLAPKLLYSRGAMVELLISSNICRYAEFRAVDRVATIWNGRILTVPCSRSDVFTSRDVNVVEKRLLMKFLQSCASYDEADSDEHKAQEIEGITFLEYLKKNKLTPNLIHYLLYTIAMGNDRTSCRQGLEGVKKFLMSLGRYGNSPFLFPMYGCGEIPQCFCRLCAVFGGIYCLSREISGISLSSDEKAGSRFESLHCAAQKIGAKNIVIGQGYVLQEVLSKGTTEKTEDVAVTKCCGSIARAVFLTNIPLGGASQNTGGGGASLVKLPPVEGHEDGATIVQLAHFSGTCPKDIYLIHITARSITGDPEKDLEPYVTQILTHDGPTTAAVPVEGEIYEGTEENKSSTILYESYFTIPACVACQHDEKRGSVPKGVHLACGLFCELDYDESIARAKQIFLNIYPDEEFLPRAPDPEEIIIGEENEEGSDKPNEQCSEERDAVENARECREVESPASNIATVVSPGISDAQEAKEDVVENAEECLEQK